MKQELTKELTEDSTNPEWFKEIRVKALEVFKNKEMASFKYGLHLKLNLDSFDFNNFDISDSKTEVEIENDEEVIVETFGKAFVDHPDLIKNYFMKSTKIDEDIISAFHTAFLTHGILIRVPENVKTVKPLLLKLKSLGSFQVDHLIIIAEKNSKLDLIKILNSNSEKEGYRSGIVEIYVKEGAEVNFGSVQSLDNNRYNFSIKKAIVEKDGKINWLTCTIGSKHTRLEVSSVLQQEGAKTNNWGVYFGNKKQVFDFASSTIHAAPHTDSDILTKGVLNDSARSIFRGLIKMKENAAGSKGYQKGDTLLLSENAETDAIPNLEIDNNDVRCSHGASIGQLDKDKLFYMMTRGIGEKEAKDKLVEGFFEPMIQKMDINAIREEVRTTLQKKC